MKFKFFIFLFFLVFSAGSLAATDLLYDTVKSGVGVRPLSMGNAFTALAEGEYAPNYNPAGLVAVGGVLVRNDDFDAKRSTWDVFNGYFVFANPLGFAQWQKADENGRSVTVRSLGYARKSGNNVDWGVTFKMISDQTAGVTKAGWSSDLGVLFHPANFLNLGVCGKDVFQDGLNIPATGVVGLALFDPRKTIVVTTDLTADRSTGHIIWIGSGGLEINLADGLYLRGGFFDDQATAGVAFQLPVVEVSYGFVSPVNDTTRQMTQMISFRIGKPQTTPVSTSGFVPPPANLNRFRY